MTLTNSDFARLDEKNTEILHTVNDLSAALHERSVRLAAELRAQTEEVAADLRDRADVLSKQLFERADTLAAKLVVTELQQRVDGLAAELKAGDMREQVLTMAGELKANSEATERVEENTKGLVEAFEAVQGGMKVLDWLGKVGVRLLWITVPVAMLYGSWQAFKLWMLTGFHPPKP